MKLIPILSLILGNHGDGEPENTETPFVAWGAGIRGPQPSLREGAPLTSSDEALSLENLWSIPSPSSWRLDHLRYHCSSLNCFLPILNICGMKESRCTAGIIRSDDECLDRCAFSSQLRRCFAI